MNERAKVEVVVLIHQPTGDYLNSRQRVAYRSHREKLIKWPAKQGKNPEKLNGYAYDTYCMYANIIDKFHRSVREENGQFILDISHAQAEKYLRDLILDDEDYLCLIWLMGELFSTGGL